MRNIAQYPLTDEEILAWLERMDHVAQTSGAIGGMDMMIIHALKQRVESHPYKPVYIKGNVNTTTTTSTTAARD